MVVLAKLSTQEKNFKQTEPLLFGSQLISICLKQH